MQISDFLEDKYKKLFYLKKHKSFEKRSSVNFCRFWRKKV